jgi:hypothetical protein
VKCHNHPSVTANGQCESCRLPLCGICSIYVQNSLVCEKCEQQASLSEYVEKQSRSQGESAMGTLLEEGEKRAREAPVIMPRRHSDGNDRKDKILMVIVMLSCVFIVFQISRSLGSGAILNQQQIAAQEQTRNNIEACMLIFWEIAMQFSNGDSAVTPRRCPGSALNLTVTREASAVIVRHPEPATLGVSDIYVSSADPTPVLVE